MPVRRNGDAVDIVPGLEAATPEDWDTEYLDAIASVALVDGVEGAIRDADLGSQPELAAVGKLRRGVPQHDGAVDLRQETLLEAATPEDWDTEYLDAIASVALVDGVEGAMAHIAATSSAGRQ
jgi:gamma-glutamyl phosphate reductase